MYEMTGPYAAQLPASPKAAPTCRTATARFWNRPFRPVSRPFRLASVALCRGTARCDKQISTRVETLAQEPGATSFKIFSGVHRRSMDVPRS